MGIHLVGVQTLVAILKKYLFRSLYTKKDQLTCELVFFQRNLPLQSPRFYAILIPERRWDICYLKYWVKRWAYFQP